MSTEISLGLSVISLIVSAIGLFLHFVKFRKERPNLIIENAKCRHHPTTNVKTTELRIHFLVHNKGDRATHLNSLEIPDYSQSITLDHSVEANKSIKEDCYFKIPLSITDEKIKCSFVLHHTHGDKKFDATSEKTTKSLSKVGVAVW